MDGKDKKCKVYSCILHWILALCAVTVQYPCVLLLDNFITVFVQKKAVCIYIVNGRLKIHFLK